LGQLSEALEERFETLNGPRAIGTKEIHARVGTFGAARASTDLACDNQRAHAALRQIIVCKHFEPRYKDEQLE
jgi:hypothetical protein